MGVSVPAEVQIAASTGSILVVEVIGADRTVATQGNPPLVSFRVTEVLRGNETSGDEVHAIWPAFSDSFYAMRAGIDAFVAWNAEPLAVPERGEVWIVMGEHVAPSPQPSADGPGPLPPGVTDGQALAVLPARGAMQLSAGCRLPFTPEVRARVAAAIAGG